MSLYISFTKSVQNVWWNTFCKRFHTHKQGSLSSKELSSDVMYLCHGYKAVKLCKNVSFKMHFSLVVMFYWISSIIKNFYTFKALSSNENNKKFPGTRCFGWTFWTELKNTARIAPIVKIILVSSLYYLWLWWK